jgi:hypothetical protein
MLDIYYRIEETCASANGKSWETLLGALIGYRIKASFLLYDLNTVYSLHGS